MLSATSTRHNGCSFERSIASSSSCADRRAKRSSPTSCSSVERVEVAAVVEQALAHELRDPFVAETLDVERAAAREVHDALHALRRALDVDAVVVRLALQPHER